MYFLLKVFCSPCLHLYLCHRDMLGRTPLHLVIIGWPSILNTSQKPDSRFQTKVIGVCTKAEACLRLLCDHGVNINAKVSFPCRQIDV